MFHHIPGKLKIFIFTKLLELCKRGVHLQYNTKHIYEDVNICKPSYHIMPHMSPSCNKACSIKTH